MYAIPEMNNPERYINSAFINSKFIEIKENEIFDIKMQYPLMGMKNAEKQCLVRKEVYYMLLKAAEALPNGYKFRILDAWRPIKLQFEIYEIYSKKVIKEFNLEGCSEEQQKQVIRKFVSEPTENREVPPVHTTGGAIDLTLLDENGCELEMGTEFDAFTDMSYTAYFENKQNGLVKRNRRLLYNIMTYVGFTNLPSEWWHYDYGDRFWGYYMDKPAIYSGKFKKEEINGCRRTKAE